VPEKSLGNWKRTRKTPGRSTLTRSNSKGERDNGSMGGGKGAVQGSHLLHKRIPARGHTKKLVRGFSLLERGNVGNLTKNRILPRKVERNLGKKKLNPSYG